VSSVYDTWNAALATMVNGNGDPMVTMPVSMEDGRWIVVRQVTAGGYTDDSPFQVEPFEGIDGASARFSAISSDLRPHIMSSPDGKFLVISLRQPEQQQPANRRRPSH
jgi:hypothetical protein